MDVPGAIVTQAHGINAAGQIVGAYADVSGAAHGFVATPMAVTTPEPGARALVAAGLGGLAGVDRRRRSAMG